MRSISYLECQFQSSALYKWSDAKLSEVVADILEMSPVKNLEDEGTNRAELVRTSTKPSWQTWDDAKDDKQS